MGHALVPEHGLIFESPSTNDDSASKGTHHAQIMQLDLADGVLPEIIRSCRHGTKGLQICFGKTIAIHYGTKSRHLTVGPAPRSTPLVYNCSTAETNELALAGRLSHTLAMQKAQEVMATTDEALAKLQNSLASAEKVKQSNQIKFIPDNSALPPPVRQTAASLKQSSTTKPTALSHLKKQATSSRVNKLTTRSVPARPGTGAIAPSGASTTPSELMSPMGKTKPSVSQAVRVPLIHLLAVRPVSAKWIAQKISCGEQDLLPVLRKVGKQFRLDDSKWDLSDRVFKDLDLWNFKYPDAHDRQLAIDRAVSAFDRMRLSQNDPSWQMLYPEAERRKGKTLSNLDFLHKGPIQQSSTPRIHVHPSEEASNGTHAGQASNVTAPPKSTTVEAPSTVQKVHGPAKKTNESEKGRHVQRLLSEGPHKTPPIQTSRGKDRDASTKRGGKKGTVPKSNEFVNDSDEEDGLDDPLPASANPGDPEKPTSLAKPATSDRSSSPRSTSSSASKPSHSSQHSNPKAAPSNAKPKNTKSNKALQPSESRERKLGLGDDSDAKRTTKAEVNGADRAPKSSNPTQETSAPHKASKKSGQSSSRVKKTLSRQRNGSSPHKPSPLGSSPPTNASDWENATQSSSSSTPLMTQIGKHKAPGQVVSRAVDGSPRNTTEHSLKRKADDLDSGIHNHGVSRRHGHMDGMGASRVDARPTKRQMTSEPTPPSSDSGSPPGYDAVTEAVRFKDVLYPKYQNYYRQLQELGDLATEQQVGKLMRMHQRLQEVKKTITNAFVGKCS